jgi:hypothetical protein
MLNRLICAASLIFLACAGVSAQDYSEAERLLFLNNHLEKLKKPLALRYRYSKQGNLEKPAEDAAVMRIKSVDSKEGKLVKVDFLSGERKLELPETADTTGNPILLNFLERDTREMKRLTGGSANYFRKRIRIALMEKAQVAPTMIDYEGKKVAAKTVSIQPYVDDMLRARIGKFEQKSYSFTVCDQVPGEIYEMRSVVMDPAQKDRVLIEETVRFAGVEK